MYQGNSCKMFVVNRLGAPVHPGQPFRFFRNAEGETLNCFWKQVAK